MEEGDEAQEVQQTAESVKEGQVINVTTAYDLLREDLKDVNLPLMTFCKGIDLALRGGIQMQMLTEVFGDKGIGKTTFCCQLCLNIQLPECLGGHGCESIFIDTEGCFGRNRVQVMARKFVNHCRKITKDCGISESSLLNGIHYIRCGKEYEMRRVIADLHGYLNRNRKIKLLVIDSFAYLYYTKAHTFEDRVQHLFSMSQALFGLMNKFGLAIVVTNSMTTRFREGGREYLIPYLGESWTYVPNQRIELIAEGPLRKAKIVKCPKGNSGAAFYRVNAAGVRD